MKYKQTIIEMSDVLVKYDILEQLSKDDRNKKTFTAFNEMIKIYLANEVDIREELGDNYYYDDSKASAFYQAILHYLGAIDVLDPDCHFRPVASVLMNCFAEFMLAGSLRNWISDIKNSHCILEPIKV